MRSIIPFFAVLSAGLGLFASRTPHMRLAAQLASGQIDGRAIPVTGFVPERFAGTTAAIRFGNLLFQAPADARVTPRSPDELGGCLLKWNGLTCRVLAPRCEAEAAYRTCEGLGALPHAHYTAKWAAYRLHVLAGAQPSPSSKPEPQAK